jgi:lysophospholipase L1-like esterase
MIKKIFFILLIFLTAGEILMRLDVKFGFLAATKIVKIKTSVEETPEFDLVKNNGINTSGNNFRVMVIGDSYIHGGGIQFKNAFSQQLKAMLQKANGRYDNIYVLDISKPSSNNFDNVQAYVDFAEKFKPNVVVLGYNYNDVEGNLDQAVAQNAIDSFAKKTGSSNQNKGWMKKVYDLLYKSKVVEYVLHNVHDEMKAHGHIMPNSVFDITLKAYYQDKPNWIKSKELLQHLIDDCKKNNSQLLVLKFTEINLLDYTGLFKKTDSSIKTFFNANPSVDYLNVGEIFKGEKSKDYILSKYDGHPNEKAHKKIAMAAFEEIKKFPAAQSGFSK